MKQTEFWSFWIDIWKHSSSKQIYEQKLKEAPKQLKSELRKNVGFTLKTD